jgi:hypothetical protein
MSATGSLGRRDFARLSLAAAGGMAVGAGAVAWLAMPGETAKVKRGNPGMADESQKNAGTRSGLPEPEITRTAEPVEKEKDPVFSEIHVCRGLNRCEGKGQSGDNKCAGQGTCATTQAAPHECATGNACRGEGGCGEMAGKNQCAGYGEGSVPIVEEEWPRLRREFEQKMRRLKMPFGEAPKSDYEKARQRRTEVAKAIAEAEVAARQAELESLEEANEK